MIGKRKAKGRMGGGGSGKKNTLLTLECTSRAFPIPSFLKEKSWNTAFFPINRTSTLQVM